MELTEYTETTQGVLDDGNSLGPSSDGPCSMVDVYWEICIEHWVPDDRSRLNRLRWFVWNVLGVGNPPSRAEIATAEEVTTVTADSVLTLPKLPNRRLRKIVRREPLGIGSPSEFALCDVADHP